MADLETMVAGRPGGVATHAEGPPVDMRHRLLLVAAGAALLALTLFVPGAAIVVIWPMLFFVPGWFLLARFAPSIEMPGRIGLSVVVSVYLSGRDLDHGRLVDPQLAQAGGSGGPRPVDAVAGAGRRLEPEQPVGGHERRTRAGRSLDRGEHRTAGRIRDGRRGEQPGRPRRPAAIDHL